MKNTHFHDNFREIVKNRADAYEPKENGGFETAMSWADDVGAGFLYTTIEDLLLWDRNFYHNILGGYGQDLIEEITTPGKLDNGETISGAFGLQVGDRGGLKTIMHGGSWMGYRSQFIRFPDRNFSVICLANLGTFNPNKLAFEVADLYLEHEYPQAIVKLIPRSVTPFELPLTELEMRTGLYQNPITGSLWELELKDEKLMARVVWMYFQLVPIDATHFQSVDNEIDCELEFTENPDRPLLKVDSGNGVKEYTLEKMLETAPDILTDYVGTYYADELEISYQLYLDDNKIWVKHKGIEPLQLKAIAKDLLFIKADKFEFIRDDRGQITVFDRCGDRVRRLHFSKQ
jgi:Beta-lactamase